MKKLFIAGHNGMVGSALLRHPASADYHVVTRTRKELDLLDQRAVSDFFKAERPDVVILAAAKVGGIMANSTFPAQFLYDNLTIASNVIHAAHQEGVTRLLSLGSSCIYPKYAPQPMEEGHLLTGPLEPTNEAYAIAKIATLKLCQYYRQQYGRLYHSVMPTNLYGPNDNYHPTESHVIPGLIRRFHEAKLAGAPQVEVWGTGACVREFLHVDDMANACFHVLNLESPHDWYNVGTGSGRSIADLAYLIAEVVGYEGEIVFDASKPEGTPMKVLDTNRLGATGWLPRIALREGLQSTYTNYVSTL